MGTVTQSTAVMDDLIWQDRDLRFDLPPSQLTLRRGEALLDSLDQCEDTKGNSNDRGTLTLTNLRLTFQSSRDPRSNLSIGLGTVVSVQVKAAETRLKGKTQGLFVVCKHNNARFEFVFSYAPQAAALALSTSAPPQAAAGATGTPSFFATVQAVYKSYDASKLYRELKLRGAIIKDKTLILLPQEQVYSKVEGVWNLSSDQGNLGSFFITNVRLVWHANLAENFNVSIPYMQIRVIKVRDSKFGHALVIETSPRSGGYILGFRMDPMEALTRTFQEIKTLHAVYATSPIFGVAYDAEKAVVGTGETKGVSVTDDVEIVEDDHVDVLAAYLAEGAGRRVENEIVHCKELGLAMEKLRDGVTVKELWNVL